MRKTLPPVAAVLLLTCLTGCAGYVRAPVVPPIGLAFDSFQAPLDLDVQGTSLAGMEGRASTYNVLGLVAFGDAGVKAAAANGGITRVEHIDYRFVQVLGLFSKFTVIAYGQ